MISFKKRVYRKSPTFRRKIQCTVSTYINLEKYIVLYLILNKSILDKIHYFLGKNTLKFNTY